MTNIELYKGFSQFLDARYLLNKKSSDKAAMIAEYIDTIVLDHLNLEDDKRSLLEQAFDKHIERINTAKQSEPTTLYFGVKPEGKTDKTFCNAYILPRTSAINAYNEIRKVHREAVLCDVAPDSHFIRVEGVDENENGLFDITLHLFSANNYTNVVGLHRHTSDSIRSILFNAGTRNITNMRVENRIGEYNNPLPVLTFTADHFNLEQDYIIGQRNGKKIYLIEPYEAPEPRFPASDEHDYVTPLPDESAKENVTDAFNVNVEKNEKEKTLFTVQGLSEDLDNNEFAYALTEMYENGALERDRKIDTLDFLVQQGYQFNSHFLSLEQNQLLKTIYQRFITNIDSRSTAQHHQNNENQQQSEAHADGINDSDSAFDTTQQNDHEQRKEPEKKSEYYVLGIDDIPNLHDTSFWHWLKFAHNENRFSDNSIVNIGHFLQDIGFDPACHTYSQQQIVQLKKINTAFNNEILSVVVKNEEDANAGGLKKESETTQKQNQDLEPLDTYGNHPPAQQDNKDIDYDVQSEQTNQKEHSIAKKMLDSFRCAAALGMFSGNFNDDAKFFLNSNFNKFDIESLSDSEANLLRDAHSIAIEQIIDTNKNTDDIVSKEYFSLCTEVDREIQTIHFADSDHAETLTEVYRDHGYSPDVIPIPAQKITARVEDIYTRENGELSVVVGLHGPVKLSNIEALASINNGLGDELKSNCDSIKGARLYEAIASSQMVIPVFEVYCNKTDLIPHTLIRPIHDPRRDLIATIIANTTQSATKNNDQDNVMIDTAVSLNELNETDAEGHNEFKDSDIDILDSYLDEMTP